MSDLFSTVLRMSAYGAIAAVLAAAVFLISRRSRCSKTALLLLWAVAALRLACPWFPTSRVSVLNLVPETGTQTVDTEPLTTAPPQTTPTVIQAEHTAPSVDPIKKTAQTFSSSDAGDILPWVWLAGAAAMAGYGLISYYLLLRRLRFAVRDEQDPRIWYSDRICSPCAVGIFRPKIYLTFGLSQQETAHILTHERQHLKNRDQLWKAVGWLLLSVHWFNPVLWLCWPCFLRALEEACDQRVLRTLGENEKASYGQSLLALSSGLNFRPGLSPLAFGEGETRGRVKAILRYKKPLAAVTACIFILAAVAAVVLTTGRMDSPDDDPPAPSESSSLPADPDSSDSVSFFAVVRSNGADTLMLEPETPLADGVTQVKFSWVTDLFPVGSRVAVFARGLCPEGTTATFNVVDSVIPLDESLANWSVDLNHDGTAETITVTSDGATYYLLVWDDSGSILWHGDATRSHVGQNGYYLCYRDEQAYLLKWAPYMSSGWTCYDYQLFSLSEDGQELTVQSNSFTADFTDPMSVDTAALGALQSQINDLLADSVVLVSTNGDVEEEYGTSEHPISAPAWNCADDLAFFESIQALAQGTYTFTARVVNDSSLSEGKIWVEALTLFTDLDATYQVSGYWIFVLPIDEGSEYFEEEIITVTADGPLYRWDLPDEGTTVTIARDSASPYQRPLEP